MNNDEDHSLPYCTYCDDIAEYAVGWQRADGTTRLTPLCAMHKRYFQSGQEQPNATVYFGYENDEDAFELGQCTPEDESCMHELGLGTWLVRGGDADDDALYTNCPRCGREIKLDAENETTMGDHGHCSDCQRAYIAGDLVLTGEDS